MKQFVLLKDFGFIPAGRVLTEDCNGNYFLRTSDEEVIADNLPWMGSVKLRREYVESLPADVLKPGHEWWVVSTVLSERALLVECPNFKVTGLVRNPTKDEWSKAFHAPSNPYRWEDETRVESDC